MSWDIESFRAQLEDQHTFPGDYTFKFIVPNDKEAQVRNLCPSAKISTRPSSKGTYVSVTMMAKMNLAEEVISIYQAAYKIDGLIAL